ncbi:pfh1 [Symbiodinium sp. KB8]|nr:pfh1 [Symbiodinium sp. KB8]
MGTPDTASESNSTNFYYGVPRSTLRGLSKRQHALLRAVLQERRSVFLTGPAGSGKTFIVQLLIKLLERKYGAARVGKTSSTGVSASMIHGSTIHSFMRMGLARDPVDKVVARMTKDIERRLAALRVLIIDEISMLDGHALDIVDALLRSARGSMEPFGGVPLIVVGDFLQLPPVPHKHPVTGETLPWKFAFQSTAWDMANFKCIELVANFRQKDRAFLRLLDWMRGGLLPPETEAILKGTRRLVPAEADGIEPTCLYCRNVTVHALNRERLAALDAPEVVIPGTLVLPSSRNRDKLVELPRGLKWAERSRKPQMEKDTGMKLVLNSRVDVDRSSPSLDLVLKEGAQVMLTVNETTGYQLTPDQVLVNGSRGIVTSILPPQTEDGIPDVYVRFEQPHDGATRVVRVKPYVWTTEVGPTALAAYKQLPLVLAYAISVHKSQGMTISKLKINLQGCFSPGQAYVAFSRATDRRNLEVEYFDPACVKVNPVVLEWYTRTFPKSTIARRLKKQQQQGFQHGVETSGEVKPSGTEAVFQQQQDARYSAFQQFHAKHAHSETWHDGASAFRKRQRIQ